MSKNRVFVQQIFHMVDRTCRSMGENTGAFPIPIKELRIIPIRYIFKVFWIILEVYFQQDVEDFLQEILLNIQMLKIFRVQIASK